MVQLEELVPDVTTAEAPSVQDVNDENESKSKNALQDSIDRKPRGSSYYNAHEKDNTVTDLQAPLPPAGGTRLPTRTAMDTTSSTVGDEAKAPKSPPQSHPPLKHQKQSPYYYSKPKVTPEAPAPMPPEGGTLLARGAVVDEDREEPLRKYYFEDDSAWVKVTFPLDGVGKKTKTQQPQSTGGEDQPQSASEDSNNSISFGGGGGGGKPAAAQSPDPVVNVLFGEKGRRSFEVIIRNYRTPAGKAAAARAGAPAPPVLKFQCNKAYGDVILSKCEWKVHANKVVVRLFKDPTGVHKSRAWPKIM
jgi:hypothetical protein